MATYTHATLPAHILHLGFFSKQINHELNDADTTYLELRIIMMDWDGSNCCLFPLLSQPSFVQISSDCYMPLKLRVIDILQTFYWTVLPSSSR